MGGGQRHSKNAGAMGCESQTHAEKRALGFGTISERLGKDAVKDFDACSLSLQYAIDPMVTPQGVLFSKEAILENLLSQKKEISRKLKAWQEQEAVRQEQEHTKEEQSRESRVQAFHMMNHGASNTAAADQGGPTTAADEDVVSPTSLATNVKTTDFEADQVRTMKAFWLPSQTPTADKSLDKPNTSTVCPVSGKKLKMKDLVSVSFTIAREGMTGARYMCPSCCKGFTNSSKIVILKPTGAALCSECHSKFVVPDGVWDGKKVGPKDAIKLERGGTGFVATNTLKSERHQHLGIGSGAADIRGQSAGPTSAFGLRY
mmetsp:Transcript_23780/g.28706  ORF Transcript_23780/g.28706 Transcript_23780/m.28706 type:complete len:317 (+) Transcript_23780:84-1034(+)